MDDAIKVTREELYEKVWNTPIVKLAQQLGVSYGEVVQACEKLNVPRPTAGYWSLLQRGRNPERPPLPPPGPETPSEAALNKPRKREPSNSAEEKPVIPPPAKVPASSAAVKTDQENLTVTPGATAPEENPPELQDGQVRPENSDTLPPENAETPGVIEFTREALYNAIWTTPCLKLAARLGISDVALRKTCKRLGIPQPSLGYWARIEAGQKLPRQPLPKPGPGQDRTVTFDVAANLRRRKEWAEAGPSLRDLEDLAVRLELPEDEEIWHSLAQKHRQALEKAKPENHGVVHVSKRDLFECHIAQSSIARLCRGLHALISELEARGYKLRASSEHYGSLRIVKGNDSATIRCSEIMEEIKRTPTAEEKRKPSWTWNLKETKPTGRLSFEVHAPGARGRRTWTEGESKPLEEILGIVAEKVDAVFRNFEEERRREVERAKQREEEAKREAERRAEQEKRRLERERIERHENALAKIKKVLKENLWAAAQQWVDSEQLKAFVDTCELQWRKRAEGGELSPDQLNWLRWAKEEASYASPFTKGYPDPIADGPFDPTTVPFGGPYPETKPLQDKKSEKPVAENKPVSVEYHEPPQQFPFWLLHRNR